MIDEVGKQPSSREASGKDGRAGKRRSKNNEFRRGKRRDPARGGAAANDPDGRNGFENPNLPGEPKILSRDEHIISRKNIDSDCLKVMRRLIRHGHKAFLVGGGVRDLLLERQPKDFDVSTDAQPENVRALFRNSRIIGRRFRLNHVYFKGNKIIEVSTFRSMNEAKDVEEVQTLARDNTYGDPQTDAVRRDLTINGLFYDLESFSVIDYVGGIEDLNNGIIRIIGDARVRLTEDPVRMLRAVRHAARTGFTIEPETYEALCDLHDIIELCPRARVYEEFQRELLGGSSLASFRLLEDSNLLNHLFPSLAAALAADREKVWELLEPRFRKLDEWFAEGKPATAAIGFASMLFDILPDPIEDSDDELLVDYWRSEVHVDPEEAASDGQPSKQIFSLSKTKSRRKKTSPLMQFINAHFEPIGVPRKERERMEQLVVARYHMVQSEPEGGFARTLQRASYYPEALALLELTNKSEQAQAAWELWKNAAERPKRKSNKKKRRRGRSRRKRPASDSS